MADLSAIVGRNLPLLVTYTMVGKGSDAERLHLNALTRMTDRAAYMYEASRAALSIVAAPHADFPITALVRGTDALEISINAVLRAHLHGDRLRRLADVTPIARTDLLSPSELRVVRALRHFAEHLDEEIPKKRVGERGVSGLAFRPDSDGVNFAGERATYLEIADWITRLEGLARRLLEQ
jgi:hypothetical protein